LVVFISFGGYDHITTVPDFTPVLEDASTTKNFNSPFEIFSKTSSKGKHFIFMG